MKTNFIFTAGAIVAGLLMTQFASSAQASTCSIYTSFGTSKGSSVDIFKNNFSFDPKFDSSSFPGTTPDVASGFVSLEDGYELTYRFWKSSMIDDVTGKPSGSFMQLNTRLQKRISDKMVIIDDFFVNQEPNESGKFSFSVDVTDRNITSRWLNTIGFDFTNSSHVALGEALKKGMVKSIKPGERVPYSWTLQCSFD